jgi:hypothetical protein
MKCYIYRSHLPKYQILLKLRLWPGIWNMYMSNEHVRIKWNLHVHTSPRCESPHWPLVSGLAMMTLTPGRSFPDSMRQREWGLPLSTNETRSLRNARRSTYTVDGSGLDAPCKTTNRCEVSFSYKASLECGSRKVSFPPVCCLGSCGNRTLWLTNSMDFAWQKITEDTWTMLNYYYYYYPHHRHCRRHRHHCCYNILTVSP